MVGGIQIQVVEAVGLIGRPAGVVDHVVQASPAPGPDRSTIAAPPRRVRLGEAHNLSIRGIHQQVGDPPDLGTGRERRHLLPRRAAVIALDDCPTASLADASRVHRLPGWFHGSDVLHLQDAPMRGWLVRPGCTAVGGEVWSIAAGRVDAVGVGEVSGQHFEVQTGRQLEPTGAAVGALVHGDVWPTGQAGVARPAVEHVRIGGTHQEFAHGIARSCPGHACIIGAIEVDGAVTVECAAGAVSHHVVHPLAVDDQGIRRRCGGGSWGWRWRGSRYALCADLDAHIVQEHPGATGAAGAVVVDLEVEHQILSAVGAEVERCLLPDAIVL